MFLSSASLTLIVYLRTGISALGFSGQLREDVHLDPVKHGSATILDGWKTTSEFGFYQHGIVRNNKIIAFKEGIYVFTANVIVRTEVKSEIEVSFRPNNDGASCFCRSVNVVLGYKTVTLTCFSRVKQMTVINLVVSNIDPITVLQGSNKAVQYIGTTEDTPSFTLPLSFILSKQARFYKRNAFMHYNSLAAIEDLSKVTVPCSGIYVIAVSATVETTTTGYFELSVNKNVSLFKHASETLSKFDLSLMQTVYLRKHDQLIIQHSGLKMLKDSVYGLVLLKKDKNKDGGYFMPLSQMTKRSSSMCSYEVLAGIDASAPFYMPRDKQNVTKKEPIRVLHDGLYLLSLQLELPRGKSLISASISEHGDGEDNEFNLLHGLASKVDLSPHNNMTLRMVGVMRLKPRSKLTVNVKPCLAMSFLPKRNMMSMQPILPKTYALSATISKHAGITESCESSWKKVKNFETKESYLLDENMRRGTINVPTSGVYFLYVDLNVYSVNIQRQLVTMSLNITRGKNTLSSHHDTASLYGKSAQLTIARILQLKTGDELEIFIACAANIFIKPNGKVIFVYLQSIFSPNYIISKQIEEKRVQGGEDNLSNIDRIIAPESGVFLVTFSLIFEFQNLVDENIVRLIVSKESDDIGSGLLERLHLREAAVGSRGQLTLQVSGYLNLKKGEVIHAKLQIVDESDLFLTVKEHCFTTALISNQYIDTNGFKTIQNTQKLFNFKNNMVILGNFVFTESGGGFLLEGTKFFGPYFVASKSVTVLYNVQMHLKDVIGRFRLAVYVRPGNSRIDISTTTRVLEKSTITLTAVGLLQLYADESVQLLVYGENVRTKVLCTRSSWSLMEMMLISTSKYSSNNISTVLMQKTTYEVRSTAVDGISTKVNAQNGTLSYESRVSLKDYIKHGTYMFSSNIGENSPNSCYVTLIRYHAQYSVIIRDAENAKVSLKLPSSKTSTDFISMVVCVKLNDKFLIGKDTNEKSTETTQFPPTKNLQEKNATTNDGRLNVTLIHESIGDFLEGFSAILEDDVSINSNVQNPWRVDGWSSSSYSLFERSKGFWEGSGMFIVQETGSYLVTLNLWLDYTMKSQCRVIITSDDIQIVEMEIESDHINHMSVVWLRQNSAIQLFVQCDVMINQMLLRKLSSYSILLLEPQPSFRSQCMMSEDKIHLNLTQKDLILAAGTHTTIKCSAKTKYFGDFTWIKDGTVIEAALGQQDALLSLHSVSPDNSGVYQCLLVRGKMRMKSHQINIEVLDSRPVLSLPSEEIFVDENSSPTKVVAWVQVSAVSMNTKQAADVRLTVEEGAESKGFYFEPAVTKSLSALYYSQLFDYERMSFYNVTFRAENLEASVSLNSASRSIKIHVVNKNEHKPVFKSNVSTFYVKENSPYGFSICMVNAVDIDEQLPIRYRIIYATPQNLVQLDEYSGKLVVTGKIDFEKTQSIDVIITASDSKFTSYQRLHLVVIDVNDNAPTFTYCPPRLNISSNTPPGSVLTQIAVSDADSKENGQINLLVLNNDYVIIDKNSGRLSLKRLPIYDDILWSDLKLEARDLGANVLSAFCDINIYFYQFNQSGQLRSTWHKKVNLGEGWLTQLKALQYWIIAAAVLLVIILIVIVIVCRKRRNERRTIKSFLLYSKPQESMEVSMYISCETLPSAYSSMKNLSKTL